MATAGPLSNLIRVMPAEGWMTSSAEAHPHIVASDVRSDAVLAAVRRLNPRVHAIANRVSAPLVANVLLAAGASPSMAHAAGEIEAFVAESAALVVNLGTPDNATLAGAQIAAACAQMGGMPWVLDPVGVAVSHHRLSEAMRLLERAPTVIRGNADEVRALAGETGFHPGGIDSASDSIAAVAAAHALAAQTRAVVAVTGATDQIILPTGEIVVVSGGHPMSRLVSGTGCAASALIAACLSAAPPREATCAALTAMKAAAARAARSSAGPGSFAVALIDAVHALSLGDGPATPPP
jgi:hydroxyethylthiazole kinase